MAYARLQQLVLDSPAGYQFFNQLADNASDLRTQLFVEHGTVEQGPQSPGAGPDYSRLGHHNLQEISRCVSMTYLFSVNAGQVPATATQLGWSGPGIPGIFRIDVGQYLLPVLGLTFFWAKPTPLAANALTVLEPQVRPYYASASNGNNNGLWVSTYKLDAGDFIPDDQAFCLALYGLP